MRSVLVTSAALLVFAVPSVARALDVQACITASERGQRARAAGKLREARDQFMICGGECPSIVKKDCTQWNAEIAGTIPSVVFGARDRQGRDLFDVSVTMDGEVLAKKLDGKAVSVDPGPHTFVFEHAGSTPVSERVLVKEGERARAVNVTFDGGATTPARAADATRPPDQDTSAVSSSDGGHTIYPWLVFGAGVAAIGTGIVIVVTTPTRPSNCDADKRKCTPLPDQTDEEFRETQSRAGTADSQPVLGYAVAGAGLAVAAGGLIWHFLEPTSKSTALRVTPWMTARDGGLVIGRAF